MYMLFHIPNGFQRGFQRQNSNVHCNYPSLVMPFLKLTRANLVIFDRLLKTMCMVFCCRCLIVVLFRFKKLTVIFKVIFVVLKMLIVFAFYLFIQ